MNDTIYQIGDTACLDVTFKDLDGDPEDQTSVTLTVRSPDGTTSDYTPTHGDTSSGYYSYELPIDQSGNWIGKWVGDTDVVPVAFWVQADAVEAETSPYLYVSPGEMKQILRLQGSEFADLALDIAIDTASRTCEGYKGQRFYPYDDTRYYTPTGRGRTLPIDGVNELTAVTADLDDDGVYETTWTEGEDFKLEPLNLEWAGQPRDQITLLNRAGVCFPHTLGSVKVEASFGWSQTPTQVKEAAVILANRFLKRTREAPMDILVAVAGETVSMARLGNLDKDAKNLLDQLPGGTPDLASIQLS